MSVRGTQWLWDTAGSVGTLRRVGTAARLGRRGRRNDVNKSRLIMQRRRAGAIPYPQNTQIAPADDADADVEGIDVAVVVVVAHRLQEIENLSGQRSTRTARGGSA